MKPGEVRLIGGQWKRSKLTVAKQPGVRPTPDRVRETLFNWLGQDLTGWRCLDAFAGTGALGLEAASRGAAHVLMIERDPAAAQLLRENIVRLKGEAQALLRAGDGLQALRAASQQAADWDLIFLDPPYSSPLLQQALPLAFSATVPGGWIYAESATPLGPEVLPAGCECVRSLQAGQVCAQLLRKLPHDV